MPPSGKPSRARADAGAGPAGPPSEPAPREEPASSEREAGADAAGRGHAEAAAERARAAAEALDQVEADMGARDVHMARKALRAAFAAACEREDWVSARRHACLTSGLAGGAEGAAWRDDAEKCDARVRSAWRLAARMHPPRRRRSAGRGLASGDYYDNEGDPDLLLLCVGEPPVLLRNEGGNRNHWLGVRLIGARSRPAVGRGSASRPPPMVPPRPRAGAE